MNVLGKTGVAAFAIFCRLSAYYAAQSDSGLEAPIQLIRTGKLREAEAALEEKLSQANPPVRALYWKAHVQFALARYTESATTIRNYLEQQPDDAKARKLLGLDLFMSGDAASAQNELERAVLSDPKDAETQYYLGRIYFTRQNMPAALAAFQKVLELEPKSVRGHNQLGQTLEALNRTDEAAAAYLTAIAIDRESAKRSEWPHYNLGLLQSRDGRHAEALKHFDEALEIQQKFSEARLKRAMSLMALDRIDIAKKELEALLADEPQNADAHYQLGRLLTRLGDHARAKEHLAQFQRLRKP